MKRHWMTCYYSDNSARDASDSSEPARAHFFAVTTFSKPALQPDDLLNQMMDRGLSVENRQYALHYLATVGYYRLSGYTLLLETPGTFTTNHNGVSLYQRTHLFRPGTSFRELLDLYDLDRRLRLHSLDAIERIEVAFRTILSNHMTLKYSDPHWYLQATHFVPKYGHNKLLQQVERETLKDRPRKQNAFCSHYYQTYTSPQLPPTWMIAEQLSMGAWSQIYENLGRSRDRKAVARAFNTGPEKLTSWIRALSYLRNLCAHHARLLKINYVLLPRTSSALPSGIEDKKFIIFAAVIHYLLKRVSPNSKWSLRTKDLLESFENLDHEDLLGFHKDWHKDSFWS